VQQVKIDKVELRAIVQANRDRHRSVFEAALAGYKQEAVRQLEAHIDLIKRGKVGQVQFFLPAPADHTRDYDRVLRMIDLEVEDFVILDEGHFQQYVQDDWRWRREFLSTSNTYAADAVATAYGEVVEE